MVILGRGGSGKSTLAVRLGESTGIPVIELDEHFWPADLTPLPPDEWAARQRELTAAPNWIMDGDLGPYDAVEPRLRAADTIIILNFSLVRCVWRALRRSRERWDFWKWLITYRSRHLPGLIDKIQANAPDATLLVFRHPRAADRFVGRASRL